MTKFLLPQSKSTWRTPSRAQYKDFLGNEDRTRFRLTARFHDGKIAWRGWFDDRDEADAFLWAIAEGTLHQQPDLWRMPAPWWEPYLDTDLIYGFIAQIFIVTAGASTFNVPSDWDQFNNQVQVIAYGATGQTGGANFAYPGGNGGGYSSVSNLSIFGSINVNLANAGCWFNGSSVGTATVSATTGTNTGNGTTKFNGGTGGSGDQGTGNSGGGGGAAGLHGAGNNGINTGTLGGNGGSGDAGFGGAGGFYSGGEHPAGNGTEFDASHGSGGGGRGGQGGSGGQPGGNYGGAGGGAGKSTPSPGAGRQGLVYVSYTPVNIFSFNLAMGGM